MSLANAKTNTGLQRHIAKKTPTKNKKFMTTNQLAFHFLLGAPATVRTSVGCIGSVILVPA